MIGCGFGIGRLWLSVLIKLGLLLPLQAVLRGAAVAAAGLRAADSQLSGDGAVVDHLDDQWRHAGLLDDGGAGQFVRCIERIRDTSPTTTIEVLTPDFQRKDGAIEAVTQACAELGMGSPCVEPIVTHCECRAGECISWNGDEEL